MPLNPSAFSMLDTQAPERLAELFNPIRRDEQRNSLADLAVQRDMRKMQLTEAQQAQRDRAELKMALEHSGGDYEKMYQFAVQANTPESMAFAQKIKPEIERMRGGSIADKLARERFDFEKSKQPAVNFNQPFLPDGTPNKAFQDYQRSLKPPVAPDLSGKPPSGYRYTKTGDLQAIPGGPADIKEQQKSSVQETGRENVSTVIAQLRDAYGQLKEGGGITDPSAGAASNIGAGIASSGLGQAAGRMFGTQNQSKRNEILMTRPALLQHIMKATGMSAKQMDSNAELKLWLSTATDPTLDIAANMQALDNIEKTYGIGGRAVPSGASGGWGIERVK